MYFQNIPKVKSTLKYTGGNKVMIHNPILPGFHADPCICRKGDDFYVAVSSFEWFQGFRFIIQKI